MNRKKLEKKLNVHPTYISKRYCIIAVSIRANLSNLIIENSKLHEENTQLNERLKELEQVKQQYLSFH